MYACISFCLYTLLHQPFVCLVVFVSVCVSLRLYPVIDLAPFFQLVHFVGLSCAYTHCCICWSLHPHPTHNTPYVYQSGALDPGHATMQGRFLSQLLANDGRVSREIRLIRTRVERFNESSHFSLLNYRPLPTVTGKQLAMLRVATMTSSFMKSDRRTLTRVWEEPPQEFVNRLGRANFFVTF